MTNQILDLFLLDNKNYEEKKIKTKLFAREPINLVL